MKTFIKTSAFLLCGLAVLASCDDDRDNNPTLLTPKTFVLNNQIYADADVDLANTSTLDFTWSQPNYGMPVAASYQLEFSPDNDWTTTVDQAAADASGKTVPTCGYAGGVKTTCNASVSAADIDNVMMRCKLWKEDAMPATQDLYVRCEAVYAGDTIYSNSIKMSVSPYYIELRAAEPNYWYLIGSCIGDGSWGNSGAANIGTSIIPLYPITGETYDVATGDGTLSWTGYLTTGGFKLIHTPGSWTEQAGSSDGGTTISWNVGSSSNIIVPSDGYYTVTLKTNQDATKQTLTITPYDGTPKSYSGICLSGDFNSWGDTAMKPFSTFAGAQNHDWAYTVTISADGGMKFKIPGSWDSNWGSNEWKHGTGISSGNNIPAEAGTYIVLFNDITGQYNFIPQE